jgi:glycosyltransferase involved in cell wall biosynthesis
MENKKIYINARFLTQEITGSQRFAIEISRQLKHLHPEIKFIAPKNIIHKEIAEELEVEVCGNLKGHLWEQIELPLCLKLKNNPVLINLVNTAPLVYKNKIVTILDLSWKNFPYAVSKKFYLWYKFLIPKIAKNSKHIMTISEFSKKDISESLNIPREKISIIDCAISGYFKELDFKKERIVLAVGSLHPFKNLERLINGFIFLTENNKFLSYKLVLIGGKNKKVLADVNFDKYFARKDIVFTGYVDDECLVEFYNKADVFVFPSLFEGFGIPPLEAMACGCPVICSTAASLPEVCGDAAYYINPYSVNDIAKGITEVLTNEDLKQDLTRRGFENIKRFSWEKSAEQMINIINKVNQKL